MLNSLTSSEGWISLNGRVPQCIPFCRHPMVCLHVTFPVLRCVLLPTDIPFCVYNSSQVPLPWSRVCLPLPLCCSWYSLKSHLPPTAV